jgi:putative pyoverdin transport system ATP-binding/permease protein
LSASADEVRRQNILATKLYLRSDSWNQLLFYSLVAGLLFLAPAVKEMSTATLTGYVFACLYMMTPIWTLVGTVPTFMRGRVSLEKIKELGADLQLLEASGGAPMSPPVGQTEIELRGITYAYPRAPEEDRSFEFGPIDLSLSGGEIVFVTGGNGSGKSTLVKLLTGLYTPRSGEIRIGAEQVDEANRDWYREHFATVFADFHLFDRLYGLETKGREAEIEQLLRKLQISHKVRVQNGRFSTTALSSGQRRRLALLAAYLEDRPVYVFDEWAADQDPAYKAVFYEQVLPELKSRGKCVVVVTHDDRYFDCGDRVLALDGGRLTGTEPQLRRTPAGFLAARVSR